MKKVSRKVSLSESMVEPIRGDPWRYMARMNLDISTLLLQKLRGMTGKSTDKDLSKVIVSMIEKQIRVVEQKDLEKRIEKLETFASD